MVMVFDLYRQYCANIKMAERLQRNLRKNYGEDCEFFIAMYPGTGDIYFDCIYLQSFADSHNIRNYCLLVVGGACKRVGSLFPGIPIEEISQKQCDAITKYRCLTKDERIHLLHYDTPLFRDGVMIMGNFRGVRNINFLDLFWTTSFGDVRKLKKREPQFDREKAAAFCEEQGLVKGKTVILSPYAVSMNLLPEKFWEEIARRLLAAGFAVYTNCGGEEQEIPGTKRLFFEYSISVPVMDYCGYYIGLRSGFTDIISGSSCKKIVFYPKHLRKGNGSSLTCYSLVGLGLDDQAIEFEFDEHEIAQDEDMYKELLQKTLLALIVKDIPLSGHSGCYIYLHKGEDKYFVIKKAKDQEYNIRLKKQCEKQKNEKIGSFLPAEVYRDYYDERNLYTFEMEYVSGITLAEYMRNIHLSQIRDIADLFLNLIPETIEYDKSAPGIFINKVENLCEDIKEKEPVIQESIDLLLAFSWEHIVPSPCHGDLTLENMIVSQEHIFLIDYLDSFYDSWMIDFAKILQDVELHWSYRFEEKMGNNLKIRLVSLKEIILQHITKRKEGKYLIRSIYHILLLNLLRIVPYVKDDTTMDFVKENMKYLIEKIATI
ncbi:MAG: hypothetical protein J1F02_01075 [Lachnospiraceae bacterium]|nr:hypothetical protein [Lachnospiraceae bacterium]